ncbi:hypothetical protein Tco_0887592 [Tanacetum coccineum]
MVANQIRPPDFPPVTYFVEYTGLEVQHFRDTLLQNLGNVKKFVAERTRNQRQTDSTVQDDSSRSGNDTDADDADIRPIYEKKETSTLGEIQVDQILYMQHVIVLAIKRNRYDLFTKALSEDRFKYLVRRLGMRCLTPDELEVLANESA